MLASRLFVCLKNIAQFLFASLLGYFLQKSQIETFTLTCWHFHGFVKFCELEGSYLSMITSKKNKLSLESNALYEIRLLSTSLHFMSDKNLIEFYEFSWHESLLNRSQLFRFCGDRINDFRFTMEMTSTSADTPLTVLTSTTVRFYFHFGAWRRDKEKELSIRKLFGA